jgi:hypothetical protein
MGSGDWMHDKSLFDLHADAQQRDQRRYIQSRLADVAAYDPEAAQLLKELVELGLSREKKRKDQDGVWAHAQWCVLSRRHAEILCDNTQPHRQRRAVFLRAYSLLFQGGGGGLPRGCSDVHENLTLAPDELFVLTYLRDFARRTHTTIGYSIRKITYGRCCLDDERCVCGPVRAKHPQTLSNLHPDFIRKCGTCDGGGAIFARKFACCVEDGNGWKFWQWLWYVQ